MPDDIHLSLEDEAVRYAAIYTRVALAVSDAQRHRDDPADRSIDERSAVAAERAATWFAGRMTDRRLAGAGLDQLNTLLDEEYRHAADR